MQCSLPLAATLLTLGLLASPASTYAVDDDEEEAAELFEKAEGLVRKGKYKTARHAFARVVAKYPNTAKGVAAERRTRPSGFLGWTDVVRHGRSANRVDVVLMGEGYQLEEQKSFAKLAEDVPDYFSRQKTFREYFTYFNFLRAILVSADNGVDGFGRDYDTALGGYTRKTYSGHVAVDGALVHEMLGEIDEHDGQAIVFVRNGVRGTGGGGFATIGGKSVRTVIHEFGHSFGGLGDEYSTETHKRGGVGTAPNVSDRNDPERVPWAHWIAAKVPGIGTYQGASGQVRGAWKPTSGGCVMESGEFFCRPCQEELVLDIYRLVDPIDGCQPAAHARGATESMELGREDLEFRVQVLQPASHALEMRWWVIPEARVPQGPAHDPGHRYRRGVGRGERGPLPRIEEKPARFRKTAKRGEDTFRLKRGSLEPGRYRVLCRALDTTRLRGDKWPWVLKDPLGLLESERGWWVVVPADE